MVEFFRENWAALTAAPWVFVGLVAITAAASFSSAFFLISYTKDGEIKVLERRVAEYESKLKVASPDEAKTKLDKLEGEIAGLNKAILLTIGKEWKPLTETEINRLATKLSSMKQHRVQLMYLNLLGKDLASSIHEAFRKAGWKDVKFSSGGGAHPGIIAGSGSGMAAAMKAAIEETTSLKIDLDKPTEKEWGDLIYLFVGINT